VTDPDRTSVLVIALTGNQINHDMRRLSLALLMLAVLVSPTLAASVFQLDVCNKHRTVSEAPGTSLTFTRVSSPPQLTA
jgi:hypothetical protein